ncbi:MAG TPA: peptide deformylase [Mycobacteriales bacterium]|nr:peptide deformylase [Mycobacteriales bacterium]
MIRPVVRLPHPVLVGVSSPAGEAGDQALADLATDLVDTMRVSPGCVGLAAPQLAVGLRVFAMDVTGHKKARSCAGLVVLADPVVVEATDPEVAREGCMSVPDLTGNVARATRVLVRGTDLLEGGTREIEADAIEARAVLHEVDHLDGLVFLDRVRSARHDVFARKRYR